MNVNTLVTMNYENFIPLAGQKNKLSSVLCRRPSTSVENPLQINPFYAKQTQFPKGQNERK